ncbi:MAG: diphosphomevalonate decarboxylase [Candidatus Micrarchaeota archaeon]
MAKVIARAPTNIAVVKYWGKNEKFEDLHIPTKSSLSFTVDSLYTTTSIEAKNGSGKLDFSLNGKKISGDMPEYEYVGKLMGKLEQIAPEVKKYDYTVVSENNFPTAAGYASSASGFAAFAKAMGGIFEKLEPQVYRRHFADDKKLSVIARLGSGSATRSIPKEGGFVIWHRGISPLEEEEMEGEEVSEKSFAESLVPYTHWPELRIIYAKVQAEEKKVKSRAGMKETMRTYDKYYEWTEYEEKELAPKLIEAVKAKDFEAVAQISMECSDNLHAVMEKTQPPIVYLNEVSRKIIEEVRRMNSGGAVKCAYTFDAGPNAIVFTLGEFEGETKSMLASIVGAQNIAVARLGPGAQLVNSEFGKLLR